MTDITTEKIKLFVQKLISESSKNLDKKSKDEICRNLDANELGLALLSIGKDIIDGKVNLCRKDKETFTDIMIYMEMNNPEDSDYWFWGKIEEIETT